LIGVQRGASQAKLLIRIDEHAVSVREPWPAAFLF